MTIPFSGISIVIPAYFSQESLTPLMERLAPVLDDLSTEYEVILVNDGSRDESWTVISELAARYPFLTGVDLMRNYGQHNALLCGIKMARYEVVVTIDDDLQHPPEEIMKLLAKLAQGYDVVYGTPEREQHGFWRDRASQITKIALQGPMGAETARKVSAFRAFRREVSKAFTNYKSPFVSIDVLLTWGTTKFAAVPVRHDIRRTGVSHYTFRKLVTHALNMMTGFSTAPPPVRQHGRLRVYPVRLPGTRLRSGPVSDSGSGHSRFRVPGLRNRHLFRSPALCPRNHRGVSRTHALSHHGTAPEHRTPCHRLSR